MGEAKRAQDAMAPISATPTRLRVEFVPVAMQATVSEPCERCGAKFQSMDQRLGLALHQGAEVAIACKCGQPHVLVTSPIITEAQALRDGAALQEATRR